MDLDLSQVVSPNYGVLDSFEDTYGHLLNHRPHHVGDYTLNPLVLSILDTLPQSMPESSFNEISPPDRVAGLSDILVDRTDHIPDLMQMEMSSFLPAAFHDDVMSDDPLYSARHTDLCRDLDSEDVSMSTLTKTINSLNNEIHRLHNQNTHSVSPVCQLDETMSLPTPLSSSVNQSRSTSPVMAAYIELSNSVSPSPTLPQSSDETIATLSRETNTKSGPWTEHIPLSSNVAIQSPSDPPSPRTLHVTHTSSIPHQTSTVRLPFYVAADQAVKMETNYSIKLECAGGTEISNSQHVQNGSVSGMDGIKRMTSDDSDISTRTLSSDYNTQLCVTIVAPVTVNEMLDGPRKKTKQKRGKNLPCAVCGDMAQCFHYGVAACEGCKGFFKRTVQKSSRYLCLEKQSCRVDKRRRNHCQYCRFQKCLEVGMMKDVVRKDGLKGRRGRLPSTDRRQSHGTINSPSSPISLITQLVRAYLDTSPTTSSLDYSQFQEPPKVKTVEWKTSMLVSKPSDPHERLHQFYDNLCASFHLIRLWSEKIPGWNDLQRQDRDLLLQTATLEVFILRVAYRYRPIKQHVVFCNGKVHHRCQAMLGFGEWLNYIIDFCEQVHKMDIDISTFACLNVLTLVTERHGLEYPKQVEMLQDSIIESLQDHLMNSAATENRDNYLSKLLLLIPELRTLSKQGLHRLYYLKLEGGIPAPPMVNKMFQPDLPY
ncbi:nuclear receptor subfamily 4 group A member 1-like [Saccoglossus kowalevskii]|uniref:Retinoic acid receptor RXR-beta-A-like n=1 Tax=Saccoglossus kowalevskii TaxID=10224 RepID=A0ABM0H072_SACKO|nr:PREDICTED: retinoic acid receptor RXR-beta-A-like [Saccoglossus kowalevskii]